MLATERHARIVEAVQSARFAATDELARLLGVSAETIRRDLVSLERSGALTRVHGGAASPNAGVVGEEAPFAIRTGTNAEAKEAIGQAAAALVEPGQTVIIDVGTTAVEVARALPSTFRGVVATCSLLAAAELAGRPGVELLVSGGRVRGGDLACSNSQTLDFFLRLRADVAFIGSGGIDATNGLTDYYLDEVATRRVMLANSVRSYVLADSSKFGRVAPHQVCGFEELAGIVCDGPLPEPLDRAVQRAGSAVITA